MGSGQDHTVTYGGTVERGADAGKTWARFCALLRGKGDPMKRILLALLLIGAAKVQAFEGEYVLGRAIFDTERTIPRYVHLAFHDTHVDVTLMTGTVFPESCKSAGWCRRVWDGLRIDLGDGGDAIVVTGYSVTADDRPSNAVVRMDDPKADARLFYGPLVALLSGATLYEESDGTLLIKSPAFGSVPAYPMTVDQAQLPMTFVYAVNESFRALDHCEIEAFHEHIQATGGRSRFLDALEHLQHWQALREAGERIERPDTDDAAALEAYQKKKQPELVMITVTAPQFLQLPPDIDIDTLIVGGIVTNGGVASTVRDAHLRNLNTILLSDGCAAFKQDVHDATLVSLSSVTPIMSCGDVLETLS